MREGLWKLWSLRCPRLCQPFGPSQGQGNGRSEESSKNYQLRYFIHIYQKYIDIGLNCVLINRSRLSSSFISVWYFSAKGWVKYTYTLSGSKKNELRNKTKVTILSLIMWKNTLHKIPPLYAPGALKVLLFANWENDTTRGLM